MKKTFAEKRFFYWQEDEIAVSLRNRSGSYGGGSEVLIVEEQPIVFRDDITIKIDGGGVGFTLSERDYKGVQCVVQRTTGTLSPGAHAGSYNGQDAYNDMLITDESKMHRERTAPSSGTVGDGRSVELHARSTSPTDRGGGHGNE